MDRWKLNTSQKIKRQAWASGGADTTARKDYNMNLYISRKDAQYLIDLIDYDLLNTEQIQELKDRGQDLKGYLEGMLAD